MAHYNSNMTLEEMLKEISYKDYNLYRELQCRIEQKIQKVYDQIESEQDETDNFMLHSIEAMEYFCSPRFEMDQRRTKESNSLLCSRF